MKKYYGFTLIELLISIAAVGILLAIAIPTYAGAMARAQLGAAESAIFTSVNNAVNYSFINGSRAVLCPSRSGLGCEDGFDWSHGWLVFQDDNANRERDSGEKILNTQTQISPTLHILSSVGRTRIAFQSGGGNFGSNAHFKLCDERSPQRSRSLFLSNTGRIRMAKSPQTRCTP
jgi:type IV fimbrial biogenesis protein FimT